MNQELEAKKEYLRGYEKAQRQLERSKELIQEMRRKHMNAAAINIDNLPHAHNITDLSSYVAAIDAEEEKYKRLMFDCMDKCREIFSAIEQLTNDDEKDVLIYRYISLMKWEDIREKIGVSWKQVHRIHLRGLKNIKIESAPRQQA